MRHFFLFAALLGGAWADEGAVAEPEPEAEQAAELIGKFNELKMLLAAREEKGLPKDEGLESAVKKLESLLGGDMSEDESAGGEPTLIDPKFLRKIGIMFIALLFGSILLLVWFVTRPKAQLEKGKKKK